MEDIKLKRGEAKRIKFTIIDQDDNIVHCFSTTCSFTVKCKKGDTTKIIEILDADFDKTSAESGILYITLTSTHTDIESKIYISELKINFGGNSIEKSYDINFIIEEAL